MRNKIFIGSLAVMAAAGLASCVADTEPRLQKPTEFVLNTPQFADQLYVFDCDDKGTSLNDITFTVSQPNYGMGCVPVYSVQVARSEADFDKWDALQSQPETPPTADESHATRADEELPLTAMVDLTSTNAQITIDGEVFCVAVNTIYGLTLENAKDEPHPVAVRVHAEVPNAPYSAIWSNPVTINVRSYVKPVPDQIWLVGEPNSWAITGSPDWVLEETEIGNKIYVGDFTIKEGQFMFRFYDVPGNWDKFSIGSQMEDAALDIEAGGEKITELPEDGITLPCIQMTGDQNPKGSWQIAGWKGGKVHIEVDLNNNTVTMAPGQSKKLWAVGAFTGWNITKSDFFVTETEDGSDIYEGTFDIPAGQFEFRFYSVLGDWDEGSLGGGEADQAVPVSVTASGVTATVVSGGKGKWNDSSWAGGECRIVVDLKKMEVTFIKL